MFHRAPQQVLKQTAVRKPGEQSGRQECRPFCPATLERVLERQLELTRVKYFSRLAEVWIRERNATGAASEKRQRVGLNFLRNGIVVIVRRCTAEVRRGINGVHL